MITVLEAGPWTTLQDGGRFGFACLGVPQAGAADGQSLKHANLLLGNTLTTAALEMTRMGPVLRFEIDTAVALTGGTIEARLDEAPVTMYQSVRVQAGQVLRCGRVLSGMRCYLAVQGGVRQPATLNSVSTDTLTGLGPPVLGAGDRLMIQESPRRPGFYLRAPPLFTNEANLRVIVGPHDDWFAPDILKLFLTCRFEVSARSDRTGLRLAGMSVPWRKAGELDSQGMLTGAIQVPPDGKPIVLLPNHGTTGGYPVIATVIRADVPRLGQLRPGAQVSFRAVTRGQSVQALKRQTVSLRTARVAADEGLLEARALLMFARAHRVLREVRLRHGARSLHVRRDV